jgi:hypothetical protein
VTPVGQAVYDDRTHALFVTCPAAGCEGACYRYEDVPPLLWQRLLAAPLREDFFCEEVQDSYLHFAVPQREFDEAKAAAQEGGRPTVRWRVSARQPAS